MSVCFRFLTKLKFYCQPSLNQIESVRIFLIARNIDIVSFFSGLCLFLYKRHSTVDDYSCHNFTYGCPTSNYRSQEVEKCTQLFFYHM